MNVAQQARLRAYLVELRPHVDALRAAGFPVEITVTAEDERVIVAAHVDVNDTRVPVEATK
jgi:hypothetical protein